MLNHLQETAMQTERRVRLFKNGRNQALRIPKDFELPGDEAIIRKEGARLIVKPLNHTPLLALLATLETLDEDFPDVDEGLLPPDDIEL
jgi:antitoxin VapB